MPSQVSGADTAGPAVKRPVPRIVFATFGSLGDLHPYIALARGLIGRGHRPEIATSPNHAQQVRAQGIGFHPVGPPVEETQEFMRAVMDPARGTRYIVRDLLMPQLRRHYQDLLEAARGADLLVSHPITYAAPLVAEKLGLRWAASVLQPMVFCSAFDPPVPPHAPGLTFVYRLGPAFNRPLLEWIKGRFGALAAPVRELRAELGLSPGGNPIFEGQFSPYLNLALFSPVLGPPQPDWPARTVATGFPFFDRLEPGQGLPVALERFLQDNPPPIVFTLGSSAVMIGDGFYEESIRAAQAVGRRAVLLAGREGWNRLPDPLPEGIIACEYAPHSLLFPRAAAVVHQGGVGTTGQAMRAGRPMLVVPFAHDQPDNAVRVTRLGIARWVPRSRYNAARAASELRRLLEDPTYARRAAQVGRQVQEEDGVSAACDALESCLPAPFGPALAAS
jgi:UDP:flavonoid glycosyltransferase YjiC (YdhE family)